MKSDKSLGRCTGLTERFVPEHFKITPPTSNTENKCDIGVEYLMENEELVILTSTITRDDPNTDLDAIDIDKLEFINGTEINEADDCEMDAQQPTCT